MAGALYEIDSDKSTIRLAMPDSAKHAQECIEHLETQTPELEKALEDIPKEVLDENGRLCINPEWCRVKGKVYRKDKQARYNRKHGTECKEKAFERMAKETRFEIFNRAEKCTNNNSFLHTVS